MPRQTELSEIARRTVSPLSLPGLAPLESPDAREVRPRRAPEPPVNSLAGLGIDLRDLRRATANPPRAWPVADRSAIAALRSPRGFDGDVDHFEID